MTTKFIVNTSSNVLTYEIRESSYSNRFYIYLETSKSSFHKTLRVGSIEGYATFTKAKSILNKEINRVILVSNSISKTIA